MEEVNRRLEEVDEKLAIIIATQRQLLDARDGGG
jgi:hypothetical protein